MWKKIEDWFERHTAPSPLPEVVNNGIKKAQEEIMDCDYAILKQQFLRHLAVAQKNALIEWANDHA